MARWHLKRKRFAGELQLGDDSIAVKFSVGVTSKGVAMVELDEMPWDMSTKFISEAFYNQHEALRFFDFQLTGRTRDGTTFRCESTQFLSLGSHTSSNAPSTIKLRPWCQQCQIILPTAPDAPNGVKTWLRGFHCFQPMVVASPLGRMELRGPMSVKPSQKSRMTGALVIEGPAQEDDFKSWRSQVDALFKHVLSIMSFARGERLAAPVIETVHNGKIEMVVKALMEQNGHGMGAFTPFNYTSIYKQAVASHFFEGARRKEIDVAIEWFNMPANYREAKLTSAMTVLENLLTKNLEKKDLRIRSENQSKKIRDEIIEAMRRKLSQLGATELEVEEEIVAIRPKLNDLNRRALNAKIRMLATRWGVPLNDISDNQLGRLIQARNTIVHEGQYAPDGPADDLMRHVRVAREIVVRFLLTALEYEGTYASPMTGEVDRVFKALPSRMS